MILQNPPRNDLNREQSSSILILEVQYLCLHRSGINHWNLHQILSIHMLYLLHLFCIACWYHYKSLYEKNKKKNSGQGNVSHFFLLISCFANLLPTSGQHPKNILSFVDLKKYENHKLRSVFIVTIRLVCTFLLKTWLYSVIIQQICFILLNVFWWKDENQDSRNVLIDVHNLSPNKIFND